MAGQLRNAHGHIFKPYYSTGSSLPMLIGVTDMNGEHPYIPKREWIDERNAHLADNAKLKQRIEELEELVSDWCDLYEEPDYGDCIRLRKRMQALGIEVIDEGDAECRCN